MPPDSRPSRFFLGCRGPCRRIRPLGGETAQSGPSAGYRIVAQREGKRPTGSLDWRAIKPRGVPARTVSRSRIWDGIPSNDVPYSVDVLQLQ